MDLIKNQAKLLKAAYDRWQADDGALMAAAVAYYLGLSLFPMLLILTAGVGMFLQFSSSGQDAEARILAAVAEQASPAVEQHIAKILDQVQDRSAVGGPLGILGVLIAALGGFAQFERAFDHMWNVPPSPKRGLVGGLKHVLLERGTAFLMLLGLGLLVVVVFLAGLVLNAIERQLSHYSWAAWVPSAWAQFGVTLVLNVGLFTLLYRYLPKPDVPWKLALKGGIFAALGWELGRQVLAIYLVGDKYSSAYGVIGSFIALLLWCYYAIIVIFLASEYIQAGSPPGSPALQPHPPLIKKDQAYAGASAE